MEMLRKMKYLMVFSIWLGVTAYANVATAGCTLGADKCKNGHIWVCESCGSQTCWMFKARTCHADTAPSDLMPINHDSTDLMQQILTVEHAALDAKVLLSAPD